jgi:asparagine synthase (glutamine-hydrolysing)
MCGIWACIGFSNEALDNPDHCIKQLVARGPEQILRKDLSGCILGFTRLAINGLTPAGMQPMTNGRLWWMCNGEIYNWEVLAEKYGVTSASGSDCEILGPLYQKLVLDGGLEPTAFFRMLDGVYAFVIVDTLLNTVTIARDPYGVRPLFIGHRYTLCGNQLIPASIVVSSELKATWPIIQNASQFMPGICQTYNMTTLMMTYNGRHHFNHHLKNPMYSPLVPTGLDAACSALRTALEVAVQKRMLTERPVAALLSGGLDSSLIASLVAKELRYAGAPPLKTFSIGMAGSQDLFYAKKVAEWIGSDHHEIVMTPAQFINAIPEVIRVTETFDTTTIRASVGNWLVAREVARRCDSKVVFNGDGSDEVFGSYLYFNNAPHDVAYEEEVTRLLSQIHLYDVLRSDRCISSNGLEPRTPFLDKQFVAVARSIATEWLRPIKGTKPEKWILRRAFDDGVTLPHEVLWRRKEAFSDGVSSQEKTWYQMIQEYTDEIVTDGWQERAKQNYPNLTPTTTEQFFYRFHFEANYGKPSTHLILPGFWMPRWTPGATDPSARTLNLY